MSCLTVSEHHKAFILINNVKVIILYFVFCCVGSILLFITADVCVMCYVCGYCRCSWSWPEVRLKINSPKRVAKALPV